MKQLAILKDKGKGNHGGTNPIEKENILLLTEKRLSKYTNDVPFLTKLDVPQTVEQLTVAGADEVSPLKYAAYATNFPVLTKFYAATPKTVTLDVGDATYPRVDLILANRPDTVDGMGYITVSKGTPSLNPSPNNIDLSTQYAIKWILVAQNATVGEDVTPKPVTETNTGTLGIVDVSATSYVFLLTDVLKKVVFSSATAVTATIPTNTISPIPIGSKIEATQSGNGVVSLVTTGLTVISASPLYLIKGQTVILVKTAINTWSIEGNNLNGEIRLPAYLSTRDDGINPTNKFLGVDINGNVRHYKSGVFPAPFIDVVVPDSTLPSTTGNFELYGSFFKEDMTIVFDGQVVNYKIFHSSNWVTVNVTTGATEGLFSITLDNGISRTFPDAYLIILGTVFKPKEAEYLNIIEPIEIEIEGELNVQTATSLGSVKWGRVFDKTKHIEFRWKQVKSPMLTSVANSTFYKCVEIKDIVTNNIFSFGVKDESTSQYTVIKKNGVDVFSSWITGNAEINPLNIKLRWNKDTLLWYLYRSDILIYTFDSADIQNGIEVSFFVSHFDIKEAKYIELAV